MLLGHRTDSEKYLGACLYVMRRFRDDNGFVISSPGAETPRGYNRDVYLWDLRRGGFRSQDTIVHNTTVKI